MFLDFQAWTMSKWTLIVCKLPSLWYSVRAAKNTLGQSTSWELFRELTPACIFSSSTYTSHSGSLCSAALTCFFCHLQQPLPWLQSLQILFLFLIGSLACLPYPLLLISLLPLIFQVLAQMSHRNVLPYSPGKDTVSCYMSLSHPSFFLAGPITTTTKLLLGPLGVSCLSQHSPNCKLHEEKLTSVSLAPNTALECGCHSLKMGLLNSEITEGCDILGCGWVHFCFCFIS